MAIKKSNFVGTTTIPSGSTLDFVINGQNLKISAADFLTALGVTGTLVQDGAVTGTPVLDIQGTVNNIRNVEDGPGIMSSVSPENGLTLSHNFIQDTTGAPVLLNPTSLTPTIQSITGSGGITITDNSGSIDVSGTTPSITSQIIVSQASDLQGVLDSTKEYIIDGIVDMGNISIDIPSGGLNIKGLSFDISKLISSQSSYTMITSPVGGSGNLSAIDLSFEVTGASSQLFDIVSATGNESIEIDRVNYNNCSSLGTIDNYRQMLEIGTGRFGATPDLTLRGAMSGGVRISTSIVRGLDNAMVPALFVAGAGLLIGTRFLTDINADLGTTAPLLDFAPANFTNPSSLQLDNTIITRVGLSDPTDATITPNITASDLASQWRNNNGLPNTFEGGTSTISAEIATTIVTIGVPVDLAGTYTASDLQHFDVPANGQLRHLGNIPREYRVNLNLTIVGPANDEVKIIVSRWDNSASIFVEEATQTRQINSLTGGRNVGFFSLLASSTMDQNDYIKLQVANMTTTGNVTAEIDDAYVVYAR